MDEKSEKTPKRNSPVWVTNLRRTLLVAIAFAIGIPILTYISQSSAPDQTSRGDTVAPGEPFQCSIFLQNRLPIFLIVLCVGAVVVIGILIGLFVKVWPSARKYVAFAGTFAIFLVFAGAVTYTLCPQGKVVLTQSTLSVKPLLWSRSTIELETAEIDLSVWRRQTRGYGPFDVGPMLSVKNDDTTITIGCTEPKLAKGLPRFGEAPLLPSPSFVVEPSDFRILVERLNRKLPASDP